jgi:transcriptional regulator with XRE-family HTH domain
MLPNLAALDATICIQLGCDDKMIAEFLKKRRNELDLSLSDVAKRLSNRGYVVQRQTVGHWETGRNNAPVESLEFRHALAGAFEMDLNDLSRELGFVVSDSERSHDALYLADLADRLPEDGKELLVDYAQLLEQRYLKKTAIMS